MTFTTASDVLIREDLSGYLSNLDPAEVPLQSTLGRIPVTQKTYEYGVDTFGITRTIASISSNARAEGAAFFSNATTGALTNTTENYPTRLHSIQQINSEGVGVSGTDRVSVMAGISDPFEYRIYKTMVKVANDQEMALLWGTGSVPSAATRLTQGLAHWCSFTGLPRSLGSIAATLVDVDGATSGGNIIPTRYWSNCYNAGGTNLDLSMLTDKILGAAVDLGFRPAQSIGTCGRKVKSLLTTFALTVQGPLNMRTIATSENTVTENVTYIETASHGKVGIFYNRYFDLAGQSMSVDTVTGQGTTGLYNSSFPCNESLFFYMPEYVKVATLRGLGWGPLPRLIDGDIGMVVGEQGLAVLNPVALTGGVNLLAL